VMFTAFYFIGNTIVTCIDTTIFGMLFGILIFFGIRLIRSNK
jgi:putative effector of murein hydrolase LrgA (UPF0299 family)